MSEFPWLRLWNDTLSDRKIGRICRDSAQPRALVIGVWSTLLILASESPQRGYLLISDELPMTADEIRYETGLDAPTFDAIVAGLSGYGMLDTSGAAWSICNWQKRQPASDSSTERVRAHRERKQQKETLPPESGGTLQKRYGNVIELDTDTDTDTETEGESGATAPAHPPATSPRFVPVSEELQKQRKRAKIDELLEPSPLPDVIAHAPPAILMMQVVTGYWPGDNNRDFLVEKLGASPDEAALKQAFKLWSAAGNKPTNYAGICDWYQELLRNPAWTPQDRFKNGNGNGRPAPSKSVSTPAPGSQPVRW